MQRDSNELTKTSEVKLHAIMDATPECIKIVAPDGSLMFMNQAGLNMVEAPSFTAIEGSCIFDVIGPDYKKNWIDQHNRICNGESLNWQFEIIGLNGTRRFLETHAVPLPNGDGTFSQLAVTRDITERKLAEDTLKRNEIILKAQNHALELAMHGAPLPDVLNVITTAIEQHTDHKIFASVLIIDKEGKYSAQRSAPEVPRAVWEKAAAEKHEMIVPDIASSELPDDFKSNVLARGLQACWFAPIVSVNRFSLAAFAIFYTQSQQPTREDRRAVELLGHTTGMIIEWYREVQERRQAENALQALTRATANVIYRMNPDWSEMRTLEGRNFLEDPGEPIRNWATKYIHPQDQSLVLEAIQKAVDTRGILQLEHRVLQVDGTTGWVLSRAIPVLNERDEIIEWLGTASDITERKQAEEALRVASDEAEKRRRLYEAITGSTPDLIYVFNLNYRFTYANDALLKMWSRTWDDSIGRGLLELGYEPWHAEMHEREIDQVVATRQPIRGEVSFPHATLGRRIYDYIFVPVLDNNGNVEAVAGTTRDITDLKIAEKALKESEAKFRRFYESNMLPIAFWNIHGRVYECNDAFAQLTGYTQNEIIDGHYNWMDGTAPAYRHLHEENIKKAVEGKMFIEPYEIEMLRPDGNQIHVLAGYALLEGSKENGVAFLMDITLQKSLMAALELRVAERTKELNEANFALKQSNEDLLQFAHVASHDLKEPVRKIKTYGYRLQDELGNASEKAQSYVDKILSSASRMAAMIEGVLSYSTINASREMSGDVDLNLLLEDIRSDLEIVIQHKEAVITSTKLPVFRGSRFLLYQLFLNLINNALKFSRADVTPRVNIDSTFINVSGEKHLQITIEDNGIGFEQANVERIFDTFSRLNPKDKFEGTGLGLALCKKIVQRHNGTITAFGEENKGAKFTITLPVEADNTIL